MLLERRSGRGAPARRLELGGVHLDEVADVAVVEEARTGVDVDLVEVELGPEELEDLRRDDRGIERVGRAGFDERSVRRTRRLGAVEELVRVGTSVRRATIPNDVSEPPTDHPASCWA